MQYFIKRGEKINGPFTEAQVKQGFNSKKLNETDLVSTSQEGPWTSLGQALANKQPSNPQQPGPPPVPGAPTGSPAPSPVNTGNLPGVPVVQSASPVSAMHKPAGSRKFIWIGGIVTVTVVLLGVITFLIMSGGKSDKNNLTQKEKSQDNGEPGNGSPSSTMKGSSAQAVDIQPDTSKGEFACEEIGRKVFNAIKSKQELALLGCFPDFSDYQRWWDELPKVMKKVGKENEKEKYLAQVKKWIEQRKKICHDTITKFQPGVMVDNKKTGSWQDAEFITALATDYRLQDGIGVSRGLDIYFKLGSGTYILCWSDPALNVGGSWYISGDDFFRVLKSDAWFFPDVSKGELLCDELGRSVFQAIKNQDKSAFLSFFPAEADVRGWFEIPSFKETAGMENVNADKFNASLQDAMNESWERTINSCHSTKQAKVNWTDTKFMTAIARKEKSTKNFPPIFEPFALVIYFKSGGSTFSLRYRDPLLKQDNQWHLVGDSGFSIWANGARVSRRPAPAGSNPD